MFPSCTRNYQFDGAFADLVSFGQCSRGNLAMTGMGTYVSDGLFSKFGKPLLFPPWNQFRPESGMVAISFGHSTFDSGIRIVVSTGSEEQVGRVDARGLSHLCRTQRPSGMVPKCSSQETRWAYRVLPRVPKCPYLPLAAGASFHGQHFFVFVTLDQNRTVRGSPL